MRSLIGTKWGELKEETREWFLERCNCVDGTTCSDVGQGECIVDLDFDLSVAGKIKEGEIIIEDEAEIYNSCDNYIDVEINDSLDNVLTVTEAADRWNITEGAIRSSIKNRKFIPGIDFRKAGRITLITSEAMERIYGEIE